MPLDFKHINSKEIRAEKLTVKVEIELEKCGLNAEELAQRLQYIYNSYQDRGFSEFVVSLLRNSQASTWELKNLEVI